MNRETRLALLFILPLFITFSCREDDDVSSPEVNNPTSAGQMSATTGHSEFDTEVATARFRTTGELTMTGSTVDGKKFFFVIPEFSGVQDYTFGPDLDNSATYQQMFNNTTTKFSTAVGLLSVSDFDETKQEISGTFSFIATQDNNPGNSISITNGSFEGVPIKSMPTAPEGAAVFYADDVYYEDEMPVFRETVLRKTNLDIELSGYNNYINVRFPTLFVPGENTEFYRAYGSYNFSIAGHSGYMNIHEYNESEKWITATFEFEHRDFEMSLNKYPIQENHDLPGNGHTIMYTDTGSIDLQLLSSEFSIGNSYAQATMSAVLYDNFWVELDHTLVYTLLSYYNSYKYGNVVLSVDSENSIITYWAFESDDESLTFAGENIPY